MDYMLDDEGLPHCVANMRADGECAFVLMEQMPNMMAWQCPQCREILPHLNVVHARDPEWWTT